jgi:hypothetical protein
VDENPDNRDKDKEVRKLIDALIVEHYFAKNYGPHRIISELHCRNIPAQKQLENRFYYFWKHKFGVLYSLVMKQMSRPLYITTKPIIIIDFVLVIVLISQ